MSKPMIISIVFSLVIIIGAFWLTSFRTPSDAGGMLSATIVDGTQFIDIAAKGGYSPRVVKAKAGMPTILRVTTNNTFDCSSSIVIPKLSYQKFLQPSQTEDIVITAEQARGTLQGLCSMGMYNFQIRFE